MKKLAIMLILITSLYAGTSDVYCLSMGEGYYYCTDDDGNEWTVYQGE